MMTRSLKGFTLIETMVAITVLIIAVVGPLYAVHKSLIASYTARDSLIATALAQEGMEYVRSVRDGNYLTGQSNWLNGLSACTITGAEGPSDYGCDVDVSTQALTACSSSGCAPLRLDTSYRYRQAATGTVTRFSRKVIVASVSANEVTVTTTVSWSTLRIPYSVTVTEHLYNWQ
ncbi:MAG: hypothetical protein QOE22_343 [Candidatus Parcubacteria bacterium]|jgi:prepilin-type N-terminal cleavage/methylation domain-containing protein|nr:hypothetical protein [Candidatus Parcubacteria bacterium]